MKPKTKRLFSEKDGEVCYRLSYWEEKLAEEELTEIILYEMQIEYGNEYKWCKVEREFIEPHSCNHLDCVSYEPCNGKKGKCRYLINGYEKTGRKFRLTIEGLEEIKEE